MKNRKKGFFESLDADERIAVICLAFAGFLFLFVIIGTIVEKIIK